MKYGMGYLCAGVGFIGSLVSLASLFQDSVWGQNTRAIAMCLSLALGYAGMYIIVHLFSRSLAQKRMQLEGFSLARMRSAGSLLGAAACLSFSATAIFAIYKIIKAMLSADVILLVCIPLETLLTYAVLQLIRLSGRQRTPVLYSDVH